MPRQVVGLHQHFTDSVITRVPQLPSLKSTITSLVDTLTCLGLVSIICYNTNLTQFIIVGCAGQFLF